MTPLNEDSSQEDLHNNSGSSLMDPSKSELGEICQMMRPQLKFVAAQQTQGLPCSKVDASDIVQGALAKACDRMDQFKGRTKRQWRAWLIQIVRNQARDTVRRWSQAKRSYRSEEHESHVMHGLVDGNVESPSKVLVRDENRQFIDAAISSLSIENQQLLRWRIIQDRSFKDIATRLQMCEPTARRRFEAALVAFKESLGRYGVL